MDARFGVSTYHNEALSAGSGLNTAADVGIPGANLDDLHQRDDVHQPAGPLEPDGRLLGVAAVGSRRDHLHGGRHDQAVGQPHDQVRRRLPPQQRLPAADAGPGRPARASTPSTAARPASPNIAATQNNIGNAIAAFLLDRPSSAGRDLAVIEQPGTVYSAVFTFIHDKWQVSPKMTLDLGLRHEFYTPFVGIQSRAAVELRSGPTTLLVSGLRRHRREPRRRAHLAQLQPAPRACPIGSTINRCCAPATASSTIPFADNSYAYNFPVKQNNQFNAANAFVPPTGVTSMAAGFPAPSSRRFRQRASSTRAPTRRLRNAAYFVIPTDLKEGLLHSWNVAYQRELPSSSPVRSPTSATTARTSSSGSTSTPAWCPARTTMAGRNSRSSRARRAPPRSCRTNTDYHSLQMKIDRRFKNGFLITNSYTLGKRRELRRRRLERPDQHAGRHRAELGTHGQRSQAHLRQQLRLRACRSRRKAGSASSPTAGRSPGSSPPSRALPLDITMDGALLRRPATRSGRTRPATPRSSATSAAAACGSTRRCSRRRRRTRSAT